MHKIVITAAHPALAGVSITFTGLTPLEAAEVESAMLCGASDCNQLSAMRAGGRNLPVASTNVGNATAGYTIESDDPAVAWGYAGSNNYTGMSQEDFAGFLAAIEARLSRLSPAAKAKRS
jgi:hypothetical protein